MKGILEHAVPTGDEGGVWEGIFGEIKAECFDVVLVLFCSL